MTSKYDAIIEDARSEADKVQNEFENQRQTTENNENLSQLGRSETVATLKAEYMERMQKLRAKEEQALTDWQSQLDRELFGIADPFSSTDPARIVSYRDAQDRAARIQTADDAITAYESAERSGDKDLINAVIRVSLERDFRSVLERYKTQFPDKATKISEMFKVSHEISTNALERTLRYSVFA